MLYRGCLTVLFVCLAIFCFAGSRTTLGPQITGNASDDVILVWIGGTSGSSAVQSSMYSGGSWGAPVSVSNNTSGSICPQVAMNDNGDIAFAWQQNISGQQAMMTYASFGGSPSTPVQLSQTRGTEPVVAINASGQARILWHRSTSACEGLGTAVCPQSSTDCTITCHTPAGDANLYTTLAICQTSGDTMIAWQDYVGEYGVVQAMPIPSGDTWGTPVTVSSTDTFAVLPAVIYGSTGEALVKWEEAIGDYIAVMVASYSGGSWGETTTFSLPNSHVCNATLAMNDDGTVILVAESYNATTSHSIVVAQRTGGTWSSLSTLSQDASENAYNPKVSMSATGGTGIAVVVWEGRVSSTQQGIRASCLLPSSSWSTPVIISGADTSVYSAFPTVWMSHTGAQAFAAWRSQASGASNTITVNASTYSAGSQTWSAAATVSADE